MEIFLLPETWIALATLTLLEIVLGIDNIIFISIIASKLPETQQPKARTVGIGLALVARVALLFGITWIVGMTEPLFTVLDHSVSGRDLILFAGGLFLIAKSTSEIHGKIEGDEEGELKDRAGSAFGAVLLQIILLDIVFSFDSILTAIGMTQEILIMIVAVIISMLVMMLFAGRISRFIHNHPTLQMLALSFLILIGFMLVLEGFQQHVPKGYIYFAVAFSLGVEVLNINVRRKRKKSSSEPPTSYAPANSAHHSDTDRPDV
jgi:predicted tellurium resistance membrane protein TerC